MAECSRQAIKVLRFFFEDSSLDLAQSRLDPAHSLKSFFPIHIDVLSVFAPGLVPLDRATRQIYLCYVLQCGVHASSENTLMGNEGVFTYHHDGPSSQPPLTRIPTGGDLDYWLRLFDHQPITASRPWNPLAVVSCRT